MTALAQIVIEAKDRTTSAFKSAGDNVSGLQDKYAKLAGALALGGAVAWLANLVNQSIQAADKLGDLEKVTGVAGSTLSRYTTLVATTGGNMDDFAKGLNKLSTGMVSADDDTKQYDKTFGRLGITLRDTDGKMKGTDAMLNELADAFSELEDGPEKTALGVEIFGKSWKNIAPMLADGAEGLEQARQMAEDLGLTLDGKTIKAAGRTADIFDVLKLGSEGLGNQIMVKFLPAIEGLTQMFLEGKRTGGVLEGAIDGLLIVFKSIVSVGLVVSTMFRNLAGDINAAASMVVRAVSGDFAGAMAIGAEAAAANNKRTTELQSSLVGLWKDTLPKVDEATKNAATAILKKRDTTVEATKATKEQVSAYDKIIEKMIRHASELDAQVLGTAKLSDGEKILTQAKAGTLDGYKTMSSAQVAHITKMADEQVAKEKLIEVNKVVKKSIDDMAKQQDALLQQEQKNLDSLQASLDKQLEHNATLGLSKEALAALELAKFDDAIATLKQKIANEDGRAISDDLTASWQKQIDILSDLKTAKSTGNATAELIAQADATAKAWETTANSIQTSLVGAIEGWVIGGKGLIGGLVDSIKQTFAQLVLRPVIQAVMNPIAGGITNAIGGLFGNAGGAIQGAAGSGSGMGSLAALVGSAGMFGSGLSAGFGMLMQGGGMLGMGGLGTALGMGGGAIAGGSLAGGLGILGGALGPIAIGAMLLASLDKKGGGPKPEGAYDTTGNTLGRGGALNDVAKQSVDAMVAKYATVARALGMRSDNFGGGAIFTTDYAGGAQNQLGFTSRVNGVTTYNRHGEGNGYENAGRDNTALAQNFSLEISRGIVGALKVSATDVNVKAFLEGVSVTTSTLAQLDSALDKLTASGTMAMQLEPLGGVFGRIAKMGIEARAGLAEMTGGLESFLAKTASFVAKYYSEGEQVALTSKAIADTLSAVGISGGISSKADLRALLDDPTRSTAQIAAILNVADQFAGIADYLTKNSLTLDGAAGQAPQTAALQAVQANTAAANDFAKRQTDAAESTYKAAQDFVAELAALRGEMEAANAAIAISSRRTADALDQIVNDGIETRSTP